MARPRYPSDDKRLNRPSGVVVAFSILNPDPDHPEHSEVFGDPELRGIWTGLLVIAGQAFAGRTGDRVTLSLGQLTWVTGRQGRAGAESALKRVCGLMGYEVTSHSGRSWTVHVKNLSRNQGWTPQGSAETPQDSADSAPPPSPSPNPSPNSKSEEEKNTVAAAPVALALEEPTQIRPIHADPSKAQARLVWSQCQEAAAKYGKRWRTLDEARLKTMAQRLREHGPDPQVLVRAIHGAAAYWKKTMPDKDMLGYLTPDTVYRPSHFAKYLEAFSDPAIAPQKPISERTPAELKELQRKFGML